MYKVDSSVYCPGVVKKSQLIYYNKNPVYLETFKRILDIFLEPERWGKRRGQVGEHSPSPRAGEPPQEETLQVQVKMYQAGEHSTIVLEQENYLRKKHSRYRLRSIKLGNIVLVL